ncbi:hypothetical protein ACEWPL_004415 [Roseovarius sp. S1116L3]|uniref:hypothetical protein n=1 Tax=Roseovarius roseus TaxID=3342636 RepID=UPI003729D4CF
MFKNYLIGGLACLVAALVFGITPVQRVMNEMVNKGTLRGVENCLSYSKSELLSAEAVKSTCVRNFQKRLYNNDHATGLAGPQWDERTVSWAGDLENKTSHHVTTWIRVSVGLYDADGNKNEFLADTPIWIDPLDEAEFRVELGELKPEQIENIEFCELDDLAPTACMTWGVTDVMGLSI